MSDLAEAYIKLFRGAVPMSQSRAELLDFWYGEQKRMDQYGLTVAQKKYLQSLCKKRVEKIAEEKLESGFDKAS